MKIDTKEQLLTWIEEVRQEKGITRNQAAIKADGVSQSQWHRFIQVTEYAFQLRRRVLNCWWMTKKSLVGWQIIDPLPYRQEAIAAFMPVWLPRPPKDAISRSCNMKVLPVGQTSRRNNP